MNLQDVFADPEVILFPLILQNKVNIAEEFMVGNPTIQQNFVSYLDGLLSPRVNLEDHIESFVQ